MMIIFIFALQEFDLIAGEYVFNADEDMLRSNAEAMFENAKQLLFVPRHGIV